MEELASRILEWKNDEPDATKAGLLTTCGTTKARNNCAFTGVETV